MISKSFKKFNDLLDNIIFDFPELNIHIKQYDSQGKFLKGLLVNNSHWYYMKVHDWHGEIKKSRIYTPNYIYRYYEDGCDIKIILAKRQQEIIKDILE